MRTSEIKFFAYLFISIFIFFKAFFITSVNKLFSQDKDFNFLNNLANIGNYKIIIKEPSVTKGDTNTFYTDVYDTKITKYYDISEDSLIWKNCRTTQGIYFCTVPNSRYTSKLKDGIKYFYRVRVYQKDSINDTAVTCSYQDMTPPTVKVYGLPKFVNKKDILIKFDAYDVVCNKIDSSIKKAILFYRNKITSGWDTSQVKVPETKTAFSETITTKDSIDFKSYIDDGLYEFYLKAFDRAWKHDNSRYDSNYEIGFLNTNAKAHTYIDTKQPISAIYPLSEAQKNFNFSISYWAFDEANEGRQFKSGIKQIILFFSHREHRNHSYGSYDSLIFNVPKHNKQDTVKSTMNFFAQKGNGFYKFYTIAIDSAGNRQTENIKYDSTIVDTTVPQINWIIAYFDSTKGDTLKEVWQNKCNSPYFEWHDPQSLSDDSFDVKITRMSDTLIILDNTISESHLDLKKKNINLSEGKHQLEVRAKSKAGLWSNTINYTISYDITPPYAEIDKNNLNPLYADSTFLIYFKNVIDKFSSVKIIKLGYQYKIKKDTAWSEPFDIYSNIASFDENRWSILFNIYKAKGFGYYNFGSIAIDSAENSEIWWPDIDTQVDPGILAPPKLISLPSYVSSATLTISWEQITQEKANSVRVECAFNPEFFKSTIVDSSSWLPKDSTSFTFPSFSNFKFDNGQKYWFRAQTKDKVDQVSQWSGSVECTFDYSNPIVIIPTENLKSGKWENQLTIPISFTAYDTICQAISEIHLYYRTEKGSSWILNNISKYDPPLIASELNPIKKSINFDVDKAIGDSFYEIYLAVQDKLGNNNFNPKKNEDALDSLKVDITPPTVMITSPFLSDPSDLIEIICPAKDTINSIINSGIKSTTLYWCFKNYKSNSITNNWNEFATDSLHEGSFIFPPDSGIEAYFFKAVSKDIAGNKDTSSVDSTKLPQIEIPGYGEIYGHNKPFKIQWFPKNNLRIKIFNSTDGGKTYHNQPIVDSLLVGEYFWTPDSIPDTASCKLKIKAKHDDLSEAEFISEAFIIDNIAPHRFEFVSPIGGEKWGTGKKYEIKWSKPIDLPVTTNNFKTEIYLLYDAQESIIASTDSSVDSEVYLSPVNTSYLWKIKSSSLNSDKCKVLLEVSDQANNTRPLESEFFSIKPLPQIDSLSVFDENTEWDSLDYAYPGWTNQLNVHCYIKVSGSTPDSVKLIATGSTSNTEIFKSWVSDSMSVIVPVQLPNSFSEKKAVECQVGNEFGESDLLKEYIQLDMIKPQINHIDCPTETDNRIINIKVDAIDKYGASEPLSPPRLFISLNSDYSKQGEPITDYTNGITYTLTENKDSVRIYLAVADFAGNLSDIKYCDIKLNVTIGDLFSNYPNPFNPFSDKTTIQYYNSYSNEIQKIHIFDVFGNLVTTLYDPESEKIGVKKIVWNGQNYEGEPVASGGYICIIGKKKIRIYVRR